MAPARNRPQARRRSAMSSARARLRNDGGLYGGAAGHGRPDQLTHIIELVDLPALLDNGFNLTSGQDEQGLIAELLLELLIR